MDRLPDDVTPGWVRVVREMRRAANRAHNDGPAIVSISVMIDGKGDALFYNEASVRKLSPLRSVEPAMLALTRNLSPADAQALAAAVVDTMA